MTIYKVWCEYDMDQNIDANTGVYRTADARLKALEAMDFDDVGYNSWVEAEADGNVTLDLVRLP